MKNIAFKLSLLTLPILAHFSYASDDIGEITDATDMTEQVAISSRTEGESLFYECATLANDRARLSCFDSIAQGQVPSVLATKRPVDLSKTVASPFKGDAQIVMAEDVAVSTLTSENYTPLSLSYDLDKNSEAGLWRARPHNPMYILPLYFNANPNREISTPNQETVSPSSRDVRATELKFQVSFKSKVAEDLFGTNADLWAGYTQQSYWQVYNEDSSRPFRAHDYQPEIFVTQPVVANLPFNGKLRMLGAGAVHHSNGEDDPLSRTWNRVYLMGGMEWGNLTVMPRLWTRVAKKDGSKPDDNPDILDYYGYGDLHLLYQMDRGDKISSILRYNPKTGKGAVQFDYVRPIGKGVSGYVQLFQGYGQSIVDYNHESTSIGVGVMLNDWMGL